MQKEEYKLFEGKTILFTPLNWGLGHAARCVPLIQSAMTSAKKVIMASDGASLSYLKKMFPNVLALELPSYNVRYPYKSMLINAIIAAPGSLRAKRAEHKKMFELVNKFNIDIIISDNRYGCYSAKCTSIFISHQLDIRYSNTVIRRLINFQNQRWIRKFDILWVPDYKDRRLTGDLTQKNIHPNTLFIGPLTVHYPINSKKQYDICVLLSGPEPQRSVLESSLLKIFSKLENHTILFIAGKMEDKSKEEHNVSYKSYVIGEELTQILNTSSLLICRSGYSTIMDINKLSLPAIFIPTPGQSEQEYLADLHSKDVRYQYVHQSNIATNLLQKVKNSLKQIV